MIVNLLRDDLRHEIAMADEAFALSPINARAALPNDTDYDAICDAFMETSRGRWFLREYTKRNRNADTQMVLQAVSRIEENIARQKLEATAPQVAPEPPVDIMPAVQSAILEARQQVMQSVVVDDEKPALDVIKSGMDTIRNVAWALRERGVDLQICGIFDHQVSLMMDGYLQLTAAQAVRDTAPDQVLAAFDGLLQRVSDIAAGELPESIPDVAQDAARGTNHEATQDTSFAASEDVAQATPPAHPGEAVVQQADAMAAAPAETAMAAEPADADTAFREIYGNEHDIEILESPMDDALADTAAMDASEDDDFIQAITDTAQELARLETLDTVVAASQAALADASAHIEAVVPPEPEPEPIPQLMPAPVAAAPMHTMTVAAPDALRAEPAAGTSLGHAVLRNGLLRPNGVRADPLAVFNRMSQAEKIAFMT